MPDVSDRVPSGSSVDGSVEAGMSTWERVLRFGFVGGLSTLLQYVLFIAGVHLRLAPIVVVSNGALIISAIFSFILTRSFTFQSSEAIGPAALRFSAMFGAGLLINSVVMMGLLAVDLHYLLAQIAATGVVMIWNYIVASRWVFAASAQR